MEILDTDYKKVNISDIVDEHQYITIKEECQLKSILYKYKLLFNGTLGT